MSRLNSQGKAKAQVSAEFMIIFVIFIVMIIIVAISVVQNNQSVYSSTLDSEVSKTLSLAKSKMDTVFLEGNGFSTSFTLPQDIMGYEYNMSIGSRFLIMVVDNQTYSATLLTNSTSGALRKGQNALRNVNGQVVIS